MIDVNSSKPLYEQIKDYIRHHIETGAFLPDSKIPSERDLAEEFGVNRLTVNKAVKELVKDGILYVQIGKGTFISPKTYSQQLDMLTGFTEDMRSRGQSASSKVLQAATISAPDNIARILNVFPGSKLIMLQRVRMADDQPMALETCNMSSALCPGLLEKHDFSKESLYHVLRNEYNILLTHAEQTIEARPANKTESQVLQIKIGSPILYMTRVTFTAEEEPIEYVQSAYRGDRYKFHVVLRQV